MLCNSLYSNLLDKIMQFVRNVSEGTAPTPPWRSNNHTSNTTPPWKSENDETDTVDAVDTQQQTDTPASAVPRALWMDDRTHRTHRTHPTHPTHPTHRVVRGSAEFGDETNESVTNYHDYHGDHDYHDYHDYYADTFESDHASNHYFIKGTHERHTNHSDYYTDPVPEQCENPTNRPRRPVSKKNGKLSDSNEADETYENEAWKLEKRSQQTVNKLNKAKTIGAGEVRRSWPEPREKGERRIVAANYSAVEIHGFFGLIDDGSVGEGRMLIVHVPKWIRGYFLDIKQGDTLHVYQANGGKFGGALTVLSTGRHKYYAPGRRVMTCTVCVPEEQWAPYT
jgi:hypothetical protein